MTAPSWGLGVGEGPGQDFSGRAAVSLRVKLRMQQELQDLSLKKRQAAREPVTQLFGGASKAVSKV